jgi:hypothetical protein
MKQTDHISPKNFIGTIPVKAEQNKKKLLKYIFW